MRYNLVMHEMETGMPFSLSAFRFPDLFSGGIDSPVNGRFSREGKAFFFRGNEYIRYDWIEDKVDSWYPRQISTMIGMPWKDHI
jgi:hypothetical protein